MKFSQADYEFIKKLAQLVQANDNTHSIQSLMDEPIGCAETLRNLWKKNVSVSVFINYLEDLNEDKETKDFFDSEMQGLIINVWEVLEKDTRHNINSKSPNVKLNENVYDFNIQDFDVYDEYSNKENEHDKSVENDISLLNHILNMDIKPGEGKVSISNLIAPPSFECSPAVLNLYYDDVPLNRFIEGLKECYAGNEHVQEILGNISLTLDPAIEKEQENLLKRVKANNLPSIGYAAAYYLQDLGPREGIRREFEVLQIRHDLKVALCVISAIAAGMIFSKLARLPFEVNPDGSYGLGANIFAVIIASTVVIAVLSLIPLLEQNLEEERGRMCGYYGV